jgi:hypothetical protein
MKQHSQSQSNQSQSNQGSRDCRQLNAAIGNSVMDVLGRPPNLQRVQVQELWQDHYRVNVFVGADLVSATVTDSYFLVTDDSGKIVRSMPAIGKRY